MIAEDNSAVCLDEDGSCSRKICECDKQLVENFEKVVDVHNNDYWAFSGFDWENTCRTTFQETAKDPNLRIRLEKF